MIYNLSEKIAYYFVKQGVVESEEADIYRYGIETIICTLVDVLIALLAGIVFEEVWLAMWYFVIFAVLRQFVDGYHAKTFVRCKLMMAVMMVGVLSLNTLPYSVEVIVLVTISILILMRVCNIKCSKKLFVAMFIVGEIVLFWVQRGMAELMIMAYAIVLLTALPVMTRR